MKRFCDLKKQHIHSIALVVELEKERKGKKVKSQRGSGDDRSGLRRAEKGRLRPAAPEFLEEGGAGGRGGGQRALVWKLYFQSSTLFL